MGSVSCNPTALGGFKRWANKANITLNYFSFSKEKSPKRQTHALKRRKIVRKKETVFTDIGDL